MAKILVVDNSQFAITRLRKILEEDGHEIVGEAKCGIEGVDAFSRLSPDLVTMDLVMPKQDGVDGIEAIRRIRSAAPKAKIVAVTAMDQKVVREEALNAGAADYILKPLTAREVVDKVRDCLK